MGPPVVAWPKNLKDATTNTKLLGGMVMAFAVMTAALLFAMPPVMRWLGVRR